MRIDTLERAIRRLERQRKRQLTTEILTWEQDADGTYVNCTTGERVSELPERPGLLNIILMQATADNCIETN